jgi:hypothetical protein
MASADVGITLSWPGSVRIEAFYFVSDPLAVKLVFHVQGQAPTPWWVSREVFANGLIFSTDDQPPCEFQIGPEDSENSFLVLRPNRPDMLRFLIRKKMHAWFISRTEQFVPVGKEQTMPALDLFLNNLLEVRP